MSLLQKNEELLSEAAEYLQNAYKSSDDTTIVKAYDLAGNRIIGFVDNGYEYYTDSIYDSEEEAKKWCDAIENKDSMYGVYIIFGMGNGNKIEELHSRYPESDIVIYEPSANLFRENMKDMDCKTFLEADHVYLCVGEESQGALIEYINLMIPFSKYTLTKLLILNNYRDRFALDYLKFQKIFYTNMMDLMYSRNTKIAYEEEFIYNYLRNLPDFITQYSIRSIHELIEKEKIDDRPAILVSAGPSLDKNIEDLKRAKDHAFIVCIDTAIKTMIKAGIEPDILITIDPHKPVELFNIEEATTVPWIVDSLFNAKLQKIHKGKRFYFQTHTKLIKPWLEKYGKKTYAVESGGSVACTAFSIVRNFGFKNIILMGQDLAYPNNKQHADAAYDDKSKDKIGDLSHYFEVEDVFGNKVLTEENMNSYRKWFEGAIKRFEGIIHVVDATEGGAKIEGTEIITLNEAIDKYCNFERPYDIRTAIENIPKYLSNEQQEEVLDYFEHIDVKLDELEEQLQEGIKECDELLQVKEMPDEEKSDKTKKLLELVDELQDSPEQELLELYNQYESHSLATKSFYTKEDEDEEIASIADIAKKIFEQYIEAIKLVKKDANLLKLGEE